MATPKPLETPRYATDLLKVLDEMYPEKCPSPKDDERDIWMYAGKRELIRTLIQKYGR